jgi:hypothetical protein
MRKGVTGKAESRPGAFLSVLRIFNNLHEASITWRKVGSLPTFQGCRFLVAENFRCLKCGSVKEPERSGNSLPVHRFQSSAGGLLFQRIPDTQVD